MRETYVHRGPITPQNAQQILLQTLTSYMKYRHVTGPGPTCQSSVK